MFGLRIPLWRCNSSYVLLNGFDAVYFEIPDPEFRWAHSPGKVVLLDQYGDDFLFEILNPSKDQHEQLLKFLEDKEPESFKIFYGYTVKFICGLLDDLKTPKRDRDHTYDIVYYSNFRTTHGIEFKLAFSEWF